MPQETPSGSQSPHPLSADFAAEQHEWSSLSSAQLNRVEREASEALSAGSAALARAEAERTSQVARLSRITAARLHQEELEQGLPTTRGTDSRQQDLRARQLAAEVAAAVVDTGFCAAALISDAQAVTEELPATWKQFCAGKINARRVQIIVAAAVGALPPQQRILDSALALIAPHVTPPKLRHLARELRDRTDPVSPEDRAKLAFVARSVTREDARDGMSTLSVLGSAADVLCAQDRIDRIAVSLRKAEVTEHQERVSALKSGHLPSPAEATATSEEFEELLAQIPAPRTLAQLRSDVFLELLITGYTDEAGHPLETEHPDATVHADTSCHINNTGTTSSTSTNDPAGNQPAPGATEPGAGAGTGTGACSSGTCGEHDYRFSVGSGGVSTASPPVTSPPQPTTLNPPPLNNSTGRPPTPDSAVPSPTVLNPTVLSSRHTSRCPHAPLVRTLAPRGITGQVFLTVPARVVLGLRDSPAEGQQLSKEFAHLHGYGPLDDDTAAILASRIDALLPVLTDEHGAVLNVGRKSYAVPHDLKRFLRLRDEHCRFPGCVRAAARCDIDHTVAWEHGGETKHDNLEHLCRSHHTLKHAPEQHRSWRIESNRAGTITWKSPSGRRFRTEPARPHNPAQPPPY